MRPPRRSKHLPTQLDRRRLDVVNDGSRWSARRRPRGRRRSRCAWPAWHARRARRGACSTPTSIMRRWPAGWESPRRPAGRRCSPAGSGWPTSRSLRSTTIWCWFPCRPMESSVDELAANFRAPVLFSMLADIVDLVLVDAGTVAAGTAPDCAGKSAVWPRSSGQPGSTRSIWSTTSDRRRPASWRRVPVDCEAAGVSVAGAIANFAAS